MYKQLLLLLAIFCVSLTATAQTGKCFRYKDIIFSNIRIDKDIPYKPNAVKDEKKAYLFDLYQPLNDEVKSRPLIIWMHGGGFRFGSRKAAGARFWCTGFARRGYLCASIEYRMTVKKTLTSFPALIKGCSIAVEDAREAVAYFKANYKKWNIDTNCIILGGNSAGGMIALQAAYSRPADLARLAGDTVAGGSTPISGYSDGVAAVINFWGAIFDANWLNNARVPIVSVHGGNDHIVSAGRKGEHFFGSLSIHEKADSLSIPNRVKIYNGYSHELQKHFNPFFTGRAPKRRWQEAGQFAADFLYKEVIAKEIVASIPIRR